MTNINFLLTVSIHQQKKRLCEVNDHQRENCLAFYQNLSTSSFKKCFGDLEITVDICMCVDIGA